MSVLNTGLASSLNLDPMTAVALEHFARRRRFLVIGKCFGIALLVFILCISVVMLCDYFWILSDGFRTTLSILAYVATILVVWFFGVRPLRDQDPQHLAEQLEAAEPEIGDALLSAVELADPGIANGSPDFQHRLQRSVGRRMQAIDIANLLPWRLIQRWLVVAGIVLLAMVLLSVIPTLQFGRRFARAALPIAAIERMSQTRIRIVEPDPASRYVARGDAIAIVAEISGRESDEVKLQWVTAGEEHSAMMLRRNDRELTESETESPSDHLEIPYAAIFAANLPVGSTEIEYRVLAGDGVTLWHTLTPLERPHVTSFDKRYEFPKYAKLEDEMVTAAEHGDIEAIVGTTSHLKVHFDQPVRDAVLRYGTSAMTVTLDPVEGDEKTFQVAIPVKTPGHFQIDARAIESELNNPFSPQYTITPIIDAPPVVRFGIEGAFPDGQQVTSTILASPLDVLELSASIQDDLPVDLVFQEFRINGSNYEKLPLSIAEPKRELAPMWSFDLMHRHGNEETSVSLTGGDLLHTRVTSIDRRGQRGESSLIEVLIVEEGFDRDRHTRIDRMQAVIDQVRAWFDKAGQIAEALRRNAEKNDIDDIDLVTADLKDLDDLHSEVMQTLQRELKQAPATQHATDLEWIGRQLLSVEAKLQSNHDTISHYSKSVASTDEKSLQRRKEQLRSLSNQVKKLAGEASEGTQFAQHVYAQGVTAGLFNDLSSLAKSLKPMINQDSPMPMDRLPRYVNLAEKRLKAVDQLITRYEENLPDSTKRQFGNWSRWSDTWQIRLANTLSDPPGEDNLRALIAQFARELDSQLPGAILDGRLSGNINNQLQSMNRSWWRACEISEQIGEAGREAELAEEKLKSANATEDAANLTSTINDQTRHYQWLLDGVANLLSSQEALHRSRPSVDLQYAADLVSMRRAIEFVNKDGFKPFNDEEPHEVHRAISKAFSLLEASHELKLWKSELDTLIAAERKLDSEMQARIENPLWIERFTSGMNTAVQQLQRYGIDWKMIKPIDETRYNDLYNQARQLITNRRWQKDDVISAESVLRKLNSQLSDGLVSIEPEVAIARATLMRYVPSLAEQATEAAKKAAQAKERTEQRSDNEQETAEKLAQEQEEAEQAAAETMQLLADRANNAQLNDERERELARDADAATAQIDNALEKARQAMESAQEAAEEEPRSQQLDIAAESLEQLKEALEKTAEHFERADSGDSVSQTRDELRSAQQQLAEAEQQKRQFDQAVAMAKAGESDPRELIERLEKELQKNKPMQKELSELSARAAENAANLLDQSAKQEKQLNRNLESSDPMLKAQKEQMKAQMDALSSQIQSVANALVYPAMRAADLGKQNEVKQKLAQTRQELEDAARRLREKVHQDPLATEIAEATQEANQALQDAKRKADALQQRAERAADAAITKDANALQRAKSDAERIQSDSRKQLTRDSYEQRKRWSQKERDAGRDISNAQRQKRDRERQGDAIREKLKKSPDNASLKQQLATVEERVDTAKQMEEAANKSRDFAKQMEKMVDEETRALQKMKIPPTDKPNPGAEAAARLASQASQQLDQIGEKLDQITNAAQRDEQIRVASESAKQRLNEQRNVSKQVDAATEQLERASRHEQRLGNVELAEKLQQAAEMVTSTAKNASTQAESQLESAAENAAQAPKANRQIGETTEVLSEQAERLSQLVKEMAPSRNIPQPPVSPSEEQRGQQLAQTLDELDQGLAEQNAQQGSQSKSDQGEQQAQQGESSQGEQQQSDGKSSSQMSQSLADAQNQAMQRMARSRQQQIQRAQQGQSGESEPSTDGTPSQSAEGSDLAGDGNTGTQSGFLDSDDAKRRGMQWGQLRERRTEEAVEIETNLGSPEYQQQIEAYFRAVAQRAASEE